MTSLKRLAVWSAALFAGAMVATMPVRDASAQEFKLQFQTAFPSSFYTHNSFLYFAERVNALSNGRVEIIVQPGGAIVPSFELLDATARKVLDGGFSASAYYVGKNRAAALFGPAPGGPWGFDWVDYWGWVYDGGGLELHNRLFTEILDRDVVVFPISPVGNQPLGWFNREVTSWEDLATIKCRATGITGEVMSKSGMKTVNMSGGEILPAVERGIIDCAEWAGPAADIDMGFYQILKHYYLPSAHEPATLIELIINGEVWRSLPKDIQEIMKSVSWEATLWQVIQTHRLNAIAIKKLKEAGVQFHKTPDSILDGQMKAWEEIRDKAIAENPFFAEVIESQRVYAEEIVPARQFSQVDYDWLADYYWKK